MHVGFRAGVAKNNPEQRAGWGSVAWGGRTWLRRAEPPKTVKGEGPGGAELPLAAPRAAGAGEGPT